MEEMVWRKAISVRRDEKQSQILILVAGALLTALSLQTVEFAYALKGLFPTFIYGMFAVTVLFALTAFKLQAATGAGAAFGGMVCLLLTFWTGWSYLGTLLRTGLTPLILLFVLTFAATRLGRQKKAIAGLAEGRRGRNAAQVIANLGTSAASPCLISIGVLLGWLPRTWHGHDVPIHLAGVVALAALAEATADTVSTTLQRVEPGTDGAISLKGTAAGIAAGAFVVWAGAWALRLGIKEASIALLAACAGLFFDSLLGATVERSGRLGNDLVNFASTLFAAAVALCLLIALPLCLRASDASSWR
jgi:uncharacterized protein (TIGR00297 family)